MKVQSCKRFVIAPLAIACAIASQQGVAADSVGEAIKKGKTSLALRLRYEDVTQDTATSDVDAQALTLKTSLTLESDTYMGVGGLLQFDDVQELGSVDYSRTGIETVADSAIIDDPEGTEVNQAYLSYSGLAETTFKWGRQIITLDNHRHIGHVGWRQNMQTYDGFTAKNSSLADTELFLGYITNVNRIFGADSSVGEHSVENILLNGSYSGLPYGKISAYYYDLRYDKSSLADRESTTIGARFSGNTDVNDLKILYTVEVATQSEAHANPDSYSATYYNIEGGVEVSGVTLKAGQEVLGADGSDGVFQSNLATLHKFQGWTDKFLNAGKGNIAGGIVDTYFSVGGAVSGINLMLVHHIFTADDEDAALLEGYGEDYGSETGFLVKTKVKDIDLLLKYATYSADDYQTDTSKLWLQAATKF